MNPNGPPPPWAPPDPTPHVTPDSPPTPGDGPARLAVDAADGGWQRGRLSTALLAGIAAVALAVFGCLGAVLLPLALPDRPHGGDPVAQQPPSEEPAASSDRDPITLSPSPPPTPTRTPASTPSNGPGRFTIAYAVTGQGPADIQYSDADGEMIQLDRVSLPWRRTVRTDHPATAWLQAGKAGDKGGRTITCALAVNGGQPVTESVGPGGSRCGCGG